jgi:hypothetical protein
MIRSRRFSPATTGLMDRVVRDRSAWSVPAGCPEPYLYDRLFSGSEIAMGVEAAFARLVVGANHSDY